MANMKGEKICLETYGLKPNYSELGRMHSIDRRTAKKRYHGIINKETRKKSSKLDQYYDVIKDKLSYHGTTMKAVYEYILINLNPNIGSYSNFRKYINNNEELKKVKNEIPHVLFETDCGKQLQFDWKGPLTLILKNSTRIAFYIFSATLCSSRFHVYLYSKSMTREDVQRCLIETFKQLGGVPEECLTDNMSSIINYSQHDFTTEFKAFSKDMGFIPKHCKVNHPFTKGKDESCNRFVSWLYPYNNELDNEEELIKTIKVLNKEINKEINQTTNMPPVSLFIKEKEYLSPLPKETIINKYLDSFIPVKVQNTMLFYYKGNKYSVPKKYINKTLKVEEIDNKLYVYYNKDLVKIHDIRDNKINYDLDDYIEGLSSNIYSKSQKEIEELAKHNLELLEKINK